jgi:hypothetical protein
MTQWYITKYARLSNGGVELLSYVKASNFAIAQSRERDYLPNGEFYHAESRVGSLLPTFKPYWVAREKYSHKPYVAQMQAEAELKAQHLIDAEDVDFALMTQEMQILKPLLTQAQYTVVFQALMRKPSVMKYLYERNN